VSAQPTDQSELSITFTFAKTRFAKEAVERKKIIVIHAVSLFFVCQKKCKKMSHPRWSN
jgi:hypothetical protein